MTVGLFVVSKICSPFFPSLPQERDGFHSEYRDLGGESDGWSEEERLLNIKFFGSKGKATC